MSAVFDFLDLPVRFVYSQTGPVSRWLNKLLFWRLYASDFDKLDARFRQMYSFLQESGVNVKDKVILELGPGNSYINAYNFLLCGARKVVLVDKFPRLFDTQKQRDFYRQELDYIRGRFPNREFFFLDSDGQVKPEFIEFIPRELTELDHPPVDFVYSVSVLEHIKSVAANISAMAQILRPGGYMYHHIDLRDHYNFKSPFLFFKYSNYVWNNWLTKEGLTYTNRWRYGDFKLQFEQNGLVTIRENVERFKPGQTPLAVPFRGRSDLDVGILDIILQKP